MAEVSEYDRKVLSVLHDGSPTWMVALRMHVPTSDIRQRLYRLERQGRVQRSPRSSVNNIIWMLAKDTPQ